MRFCLVLKSVTSGELERLLSVALSMYIWTPSGKFEGRQTHTINGENAAHRTLVSSSIEFCADICGVAWTGEGMTNDSAVFKNGDFGAFVRYILGGFRDKAKNII